MIGSQSNSSLCDCFDDNGLSATNSCTALAVWRSVLKVIGGNGKKAIVSAFRVYIPCEAGGWILANIKCVSIANLES